MRSINFYGIGIESGQEKLGLAHSHQYFRSYIPLLEEMGLRIADHGEVLCVDQPGAKIYSTEAFKNLDWRPYRAAYSKVKDLLRFSSPLLCWGGDHSISLSTVGAFSSTFPDGHVVWIDAHADINVPLYSPSGHLHGMPVAILLNLKSIKSEHFSWLKGNLDPKRLIYVGLRDIDPFEMDVLRGLGVKIYSADEVRKSGIEFIGNEILKRTQGTPLHVSFDVDSLSPEFAPSTGTISPHGLSRTELVKFGQLLAQHSRIRSVDVTEINPRLGSDEEVHSTFYSAISFLIALLTPNQGGPHVGTCRPNQIFHAAQME